MEQHRCYGCMAMITEEICPHCGYSGQDDLPHQLEAGTMLRGQYILGRVLGQGGFGITYLGYDQSLQEVVAVKEFYPTAMVSRNARVSRQVTVSYSKLRQQYQQSRDRFLREAQALARLRHIPQIVHIRDFFEENDTAYIVMEYVRGQELGKYVCGQGGTLSPEVALKILQPVILALDKVHQAGLVHRDISPDNIMLLSDGGVKIIDFGASRESTEGEADKDLTASTDAILKHGYAPIEQYRRHGSLGPWTDVYALCGVIWFCLTGMVPPDAPAIAMGEESMDWENIRGLTPQQVDVLKKGTAVKAKDRLPSAWALAQGLYSAAPGKKKKRWLLPAAGGAAVLVASAALLWVFSSAKEDVVIESVPDASETHAPTTQPVAEPSTEPPTTAPVKRWEDNVLCYDPLSRLCQEQVLLESGSYTDGRNVIESVTFLDTLADAPESAADLSAGDSGKVLGWLDGNHVFIGADGGINGKLATAHLFEGCTGLNTVTFGENFQTDEATDMTAMFGNCLELTSVDAENLDTSGVVTMEYMFSDCEALQRVPVSDWDTGCVQNMAYMFTGCLSLQKVDVGSWDTWNVTNMSGMFKRCMSLESLDLSRWDTGNVEQMDYMFSDCYSLKELDVTYWNTGSVRNMKAMFRYCSSLERLNVERWNVSSVTDMSDAFKGCENLSYLLVSNWDISSVTSISGMFRGCWSIYPDVYAWDFSSVTNYNYFMEDHERIQGMPWREYIESEEWKNYG